MAGQDIVQNMIETLGQSQDKRFPAALAEHFVDIEERTEADFLNFLKLFSGHVKFYPSNGGSVLDWQGFFPYDADQAEDWLASLGSDTEPHLALLLAFFEVYKKPKELLNRLTAKHLEFYYSEVLRLKRESAMPDRAHLAISLKNNAPPTAIGPTHSFSAGKDQAGVELIYRPSLESIVNNASITTIGSMFIDTQGAGIVRYAPIANSSDGLGGELDKNEPRWRGFGHAGLPVAETGFALSSPVLRMQEGLRKVSVSLTLANFSSEMLTNAKLDKAFNVYISGEKSWIGPLNLTPTISTSVLSFDFTLAEEDEAIVDYDREIHGYNFDSQAPLLQVFLNTDQNASIGYESFVGVRLTRARLAVDVQGIRNLQLENDAGKLNPDKAFLPFGSQPAVGSRFVIGCQEALAKKLSGLKFTIQWKGAPSDFSDYYSDYKNTVINNSYFTAGVSFNDTGSLSALNDSRALFEPSDASAEHEIGFSTTPDLTPATSQNNAQIVYALSYISSAWAKNHLYRALLGSPVLYSAARAKPEPQRGFVTLSLNQGFEHKNYRKEHVENLMTYAKVEGTLVMLNEPYTPEIQSIKMSYQAFTDEINIESQASEDFANPDLGFYHLGYFGQMREHGYQRNLFDFVVDKNVSLLPQYGGSGELLLGIENLKAGDSLSILFQVAEGSADPELAGADIAWSVLCDNYWKKLGSEELISDSSNQLLTSGLIRFVIPQQATTANTLLPGGAIWLRAEIAGDVGAVCQLVDVVANVIEVRFKDQGNDPQHLASALPAASIARLKTGIASVKSVSQPYASIDGKLAEIDSEYRTRVAERLRHKDRSLTAWDGERLILSRFPGLHKVKNIPHANPKSWLAPGHVMVILVPDLTNKNAINPLQPRTDSDTISQVLALLKSRSGMQVKYHVRNPRYQKIKLNFTVKFKTGYEFNYYSKQLNTALLQYLSPWAYDGGRDISFGGRIYKSVLLDFVEEIDYVDFVTDFKLYSHAETTSNLIDVAEVSPSAPDVILVSDEQHLIGEYNQG
jgi:hypothetical protein